MLRLLQRLVIYPHRSLCFQRVSGSTVRRCLIVPDNKASCEEQHLPGCSVHRCIAAVMPAVSMNPLQHEIVVWDSRVLEVKTLDVKHDGTIVIFLELRVSTISN